MIRMKLMFFLFSYTSPLQNHYFWVPMEAKMQPTWEVESIFIAIEDDGRKVMLLREGVEELGLAGPWARA